MSEALCQCGHVKNDHFRTTGGCGVPECGCTCLAFTPPPTREPIRLTAEERAQLRGVLHEFKSRVCDDGCSDGLYAAVESILAARLAGGPTLADAWDEGYAQGQIDGGDNYGWGADEESPNPYRTPESEDTE